MKIRLIQKAIDILRNKKANAYIRGKHTCVDKSSVIDSHCEIGDYTSVGRDVDITRAKIGRYCSIASHVRIGQGEHNLDEVSTSTLLSYRGGYHDLTQKDCIIKNDVWIGVNAVIRRGVTVGNGAVVGANSFVNKDVPDFAVVGGCPARIIKFRFDEETQKRIIASTYWDYAPEDAKKIIDTLDINH